MEWNIPVLFVVFNAHKERKHGDKEHSCDLCSYVTKGRSYLSNHKMAKHQERKYQCDQCDYKAVYNCNLENHKKSIHEAKKEQVPIKEEKEKMQLLTQSCEKGLKRPSYIIVTNVVTRPQRTNILKNT